jgi:hypothetical protein
MVESLVRLLGALAARGANSLAEAQKQAEPLLVRLDPQRRAKVLMALLGLVLLGALLMAIAALGGRHVLRTARTRPRPTSHNEDEWYRKPLVPKEPPDHQAHQPD